MKTEDYLKSLKVIGTNIKREINEKVPVCPETMAYRFPACEQFEMTGCPTIVPVLSQVAPQFLHSRVAMKLR
jgi:hypothetical protein